MPGQRCLLASRKTFVLGNACGRACCTDPNPEISHLRSVQQCLYSSPSHISNGKSTGQRLIPLLQAM